MYACVFLEVQLTILKSRQIFIEKIECQWLDGAAILESWSGKLMHSWQDSLTCGQDLWGKSFQVNY